MVQPELRTQKQKQKKGIQLDAFSQNLKQIPQGLSRLFLGISLVLVHELINTSSGVNQFQLTRKEGV